MAKIKKKGTSGAAKNYLTRSQAVRKLQISLADFRRLCIFKGIYPREPRSKKRVSKSSTPSTTFYYAKDIQYLLHEPLLNKFRDQKSLAKKISKALGRNEPNEAVRLERNLKPRLKLDHIIKERYPTFVDALRDLDDALSMLFLFANLPSTTEVPSKIISRCQRLTREFELYLIRTHSVRKSFLSIKGIYYQATIQGQDILWLVPYRFVQRSGPDVDFRIMATFVDFYTTLLGFVNFRLYTSIGLVYPPRLDQKSEEGGAELGAFQLEGRGLSEDVSADVVSQTEVNEKAQAEADKLLSLPSSEQTANGDSQVQNNTETTLARLTEAEENDQEPSAALDQFKQIDESADALDQPSLTADSATAATLFEPFTFFLSRETPRHSLEFLVKAFGCKRVGWDSTLGDGAYCREDDSRITHQVVDRPDLPLPSPPLTDGEGANEPEVDEDGEPVRRPQNVRVPGRIYVQPQWVWDSINSGMVQRADLYAPGATLPPHLSPWVKPKKGEYDPTKSLAEQETEAEAEAAAQAEEDEDEEVDESDEVDVGSEGEEVEGVRGDEEARELEKVSAEEDDTEGGMQVELAGSESESEAEVAEGDVDEFGGFSDVEDTSALDDEARAAREHQAELEAEVKGGRQPDSDAKTVKKQKQETKKRQASRAEREEAEDIERRKMMMSRRKRKMFDKMQYSNAKKDEEAEKMRSKRRKVEKELSRGAKA